MIRTTTLAAVLAITTVGLVGCSKEKNDESNSEATATKTTAGNAETTSTAVDPKATDPAPPAKEKAVPATDIKIDEEVMAEIKSIASTCEVLPERMTVTCANKEDETLKNVFYGYGDKAKDRVATIGTFAVALSDKDPKIQTIAAKLLGSKFSQGWGPKVAVGQVDASVAALLRAAIPTLPGDYPARNAVVATVYASSLSDTDAEMHAFLEGAEDEHVQRSGWEATMFYGRMKAFDKVQALAASGEPKKILTAVTAANNMFKYTDEERAKVCPWAHALLGADAEDVKESDIFEEAGYVLTKCSGEWVDKLLDWGEAQEEKNVFDRKYYFVYRELCHSVMKGVDKVGATPEQCNRNFAFLEKAANNKGIEPKFRAWALDSISYARRDEASYKLMKKYKKSKVPEIKKVAEDALEMLEGYVKKK